VLMPIIAYELMLVFYSFPLCDRLAPRPGPFFDLVEAFFCVINGSSEETCGVRQSSILVHGKLRPSALSRVDSFGYGRATYPFLTNKRGAEHWQLL